VIPIYQNLINIYIDDKSLSMIDRDNDTLPCCEKILEILDSWSLSVDLYTANRVDSLSNDEIDDILQILSVSERIEINLISQKIVINELFLMLQ
jgi:hypothetical protein